MSCQQSKYGPNFSGREKGLLKNISFADTPLYCDFADVYRLPAIIELPLFHDHLEN